MLRGFKISLLVVILAICFHEIDSHGRLLEPAARTSAWRKFGNLFPPNYSDNQMFCGGSSQQWDRNGGKCGICGENYAQNPKKWERGGVNYRNLVVKEYNQGDTIKVNVEITANHKGYFEFRVCNIDGQSGDATQQCLDQTILFDTQGNSRFSIDYTKTGMFIYDLVLPAGLYCEHCVFQWKYNTGNSWGVDPVTKKGGLGLGGQEQFYGCSDIQIRTRDGQVKENPNGQNVEYTKPGSNQAVTNKPDSNSCSQKRDYANREETYAEKIDDLIEFLNGLKELTKLL